MKWRGFNSNDTCHRGAKFPNAHGNFQDRNLLWKLKCELLGRGGRKKGNPVEVGEINGRIQQLRELNHREHGGEMVGGKLRTAGHGSGQISVGKLDEKIT